MQFGAKKLLFLAIFWIDHHHVSWQRCSTMDQHVKTTKENGSKAIHVTTCTQDFISGNSFRKICSRRCHISPKGVNSLWASAPKLVAIIIGCKKSEKHMSENARAMMNQCVAFILFLRVHRVMTTIRLATIETTTERYTKRVDVCFHLSIWYWGILLTTYQPKWQTAQWGSCKPVGECRRIFQPRHHCLLLQHRRLCCCCSRWQQAGKSS